MAGTTDRRKGGARQSLCIGIDIGGTHSDGVLAAGTRILAAAKVGTCHEDLLVSIRALLARLLEGRNAAEVAAVKLSTTLTTNAIVTGRIAAVALLVSGGPGIAAEHYRIGPQFHQIRGSLNHVGLETAALDRDELAAALAECRQAGIRHYAVVSKFSPRNPVHEVQMAAAVQAYGAGHVLSCGHQLSGSLNFGRRIGTAYFNAAVSDIARNFAGALGQSLKDFSLEQAGVHILKADGGTLPLARALDMPVQSILSGPAASVMGALATLSQHEDVALLDIGGTTTDLALLADGQPLLEREGIALAGRPTLVRALRVQSIGLGGDSAIHVEKGRVSCGPERSGPCMAAGGREPAVMDACNVLGRARYGDVAASKAGLLRLAASCGMPAETLAQAALDCAAQTIHRALLALIEEVNSKPLYTIQEILTERRIAPKRLVLIGGPAAVFRPLLEEQTGLPVLCPQLAGITNAIGAALCRPTGILELHANTARRTLLATAAGVVRHIDRNFTLQDAVAEAKKLLQASMEESGMALEPDDMQLVQADAFNMVEDCYTSGQNMRVRVQVKPAVLGQAEVPATCRENEVRP